MGNLGSPREQEKSWERVKNGAGEEREAGAGAGAGAGQDQESLLWRDTQSPM